MPERQAIITAFLAQTPWAQWQRQAVTGDASGRSYTRLSQGDQSVIVMDAPPALGEDTAPFAKIARFLAAQGLCPPDILAHDPDQGLMVLADFGPHDFAAQLRITPQDETTLYTAAVDVLARLDGLAPPQDLIRMTPQIGADMVMITGQYYAGKDITRLTRAVGEALDRFAPTPNRLALRDYHAENLFWRPGQEGLARVGLIDFQDAFIAPAGYDLASLLRDIRRDVSPALAQRMTAHFVQLTGQGTDFPAQLATLGAQRNLRILGVFARLAKDRAKPHYLQFLPQVWTNLQRDLAHPGLSDLAGAVAATLPAPSPDHIATLQP